MERPDFARERSLSEVEEIVTLLMEREPMRTLVQAQGPGGPALARRSFYLYLGSCRPFVKFPTDSDHSLADNVRYAAQELQDAMDNEGVYVSKVRSTQAISDLKVVKEQPPSPPEAIREGLLKAKGGCFVTSLLYTCHSRSNARLVEQRMQARCDHLRPGHKLWLRAGQPGSNPRGDDLSEDFKGHISFVAVIWAADNPLPGWRVRASIEADGRVWDASPQQPLACPPRRSIDMRGDFLRPVQEFSVADSELLCVAVSHVSVVAPERLTPARPGLPAPGSGSGVWHVGAGGPPGAGGGGAGGAGGGGAGSPAPDSGGGAGGAAGAGFFASRLEQVAGGPTLGHLLGGMRSGEKTASNALGLCLCSQRSPTPPFNHPFPQTWRALSAQQPSGRAGARRYCALCAG